MDFSFRQLQTFVAVMRCGSISEAARSLGRTQPAVSSTIAGLEAEIGFDLFERERKRLVPKPEAHYFLEEAEVVLKRLSKARRTIQEIGNLQKGVLRIACNPAASTFFAPATVGEFIADKPDVNVSLMMRSSAVVTDWVASQQYDIGFAETQEARGTIRSMDFEFGALCAVPASSELASRSRITPRDLHDLPMAQIYEEHPMSVQIRRAFDLEGVNLRKRIEVRTYVPALHLVAQNLCYVICDSFTAYSYVQSFGARSGVVFRPFEPVSHLRMSLLWPADRPASRLAEQLLELMRVRLEQYTSYRG